MVSVGLYKIIMHENKHDQIIILKEKDGQRQIPIIIGVAEAAAIKMKVSDKISIYMFYSIEATTTSKQVKCIHNQTGIIIISIDCNTCCFAKFIYPLKKSNEFKSHNNIIFFATNFKKFPISADSGFKIEIFSVGYRYCSDMF